MTDTATAEWEVHELPNGTSVAYNSERHAYYREAKNGKGSGRLTACTTIAKCMDTGSKDGLLNWAANLTLEGVAALLSVELDVDWTENPPDFPWLFSAEGMRSALEESELTWKDIRAAAGTRGTNVHKHTLEALAKGAVLPAYDAMTDEEKGYAQGVVAWWLEAEPKVIAAESLVADLEIGIAGRFDLLYEDRQGRICSADAKTGKYVGASDACQQAGYRLMCESSGYPVPEVGYLLHVREDGSHRAVEVDLDPADFLAALDVYRRSARLGKMVRG